MRAAVAIACCCLLASAVAAAPEPEGPDQRGLMTLLKDRMTGQPVIAVGVGDIENGVHFDEAVYAKETKTIGRLQAIASAVSAEKATYIPFLVRNTWVIAPETRTEVRTDLTGLSDLQAEGGGLLLDQVVLSLAPDLLAQAGSDAGIPASRLTADARQMLALALKPPIKVTKSREGTITLRNGEKRETWVSDPLGVITETLDLSTVRLRARLWIEAARVVVGNSYQRLGKQRLHGVPEAVIGGWRDVEAPVETVASNRFKPSDLDGKPYTQPFGASGVMTVAEALQKVEKATGLTLNPYAYAHVPVFVGSPTVTCGEVLDGLRLAVTGAWRKVGQGYLLCWDRRGLAALNQMLEETSRGLVDRVNGIASTVRDDPRWLDIAMKMPFASNDPLALTEEQRRKVYGDIPAEEELESISGKGIPFAEMTPEQQAYLVECAKTDQMDIYPEDRPSGMLPNPVHRPFTTEDVHSAQLGAGFFPKVALEVQLPGFGWVRRVLESGRSLQPYQIRQLREKVALPSSQKGKDGVSDSLLEAEPHPEPPPGTYAPKPFTIAAPERAIMVGPLRSAQLKAVAGQMKAKGFGTLFYPVLYEGYATFPNTAFPEHPDLKGENGFAAALSAAKPRGIRVVGYLSPIAWRSQRNGVHWLEKHPDWLDRDPLGRTRLEWLKDRELRRFPPLTDLPETARCDYVCPAVPEVVQRLDTLVEAFSRLPASGLMVLDWRRQTFIEEDRRALPPLGFALAERLEWLAKTRQDPLDAPPGVTYGDSVFVTDMLDPRLLGNRATGAYSGLMIRDGEVRALPPFPDPYAPLVDRVLARAKALRKDWTTYLVQDPAALLNEPQRPGSDAAPPKPTPKADRTLANWGHGSAADGIIVPDLPWDEAPTGGWVPAEVKTHSGLLFLDWSEQGLSRNARMAVMDFRRRPAGIAEVMKYVK